MDKEYIEREAAIAEVTMMAEDRRIPVDSYGGEVVGEVIRLLRGIPAADVRPVITCGKCKHWFENGTDYCSCDRDALLRERNFFCAAGEKREES